MHKDLVCVSVCVNYSDYLNLTLPFNLNHINNKNYYIVTDENDHKTANIVEKYKCNIIKTNLFYFNGAIFDKGRGIDYSLKQLHNDIQYVLYLDTDTIISKEFVDIDLNKLDKNKMYGTDRLHIDNEKEFNDFRNGKIGIKELWKDNWGDFGWGYFQLFNLQFLKENKVYPLYPYHVDASFSDFLFRYRYGGSNNKMIKGKWMWDNRFQEKLPVCSISLTPVDNISNNAGRKSKLIDW